MIDSVSASIHAKIDERVMRISRPMGHRLGLPQSANVLTGWMFLWVLLIFAPAAHAQYNGWSRFAEWQVANMTDVSTRGGRVLVARTTDVQIFDLRGTLIASYTCPSPVAALDSASSFVIQCGANSPLQRRSLDGTLLSTLATTGTASGQVVQVGQIGVSSTGGIAVADTTRQRIIIFAPTGAFVREWIWAEPSQPVFAIQFEGYVHLAREGRIERYNLEGSVQSLIPDQSIRSFLGIGMANAIYARPNAAFDIGACPVEILSMLSGPVAELERELCVEIFLGGISVFTSRINDIAIGNDGIIALRTRTNLIRTFVPGYRVRGSYLRAGSPPLAMIDEVSVDNSGGRVRVSYSISDPDSPQITIAAGAFLDGTRSLASFVRARTFVEGTATNIGSVAPRFGASLVWDAAADLGSAIPVVRLQMALMAKDQRDLLDLHFVVIPAGIPAPADPELTIASTPVAEAELLELWYWLVASGDPSISFTNREVRAVGGAFAGQLLASGTTTTAAGRNFLWQRLGVREATAAEIARAQTGTTPGVQQYQPRRQVNGRPVAVNEIGVESSSTGGLWLVKLSN